MFVHVLLATLLAFVIGVSAQMTPSSTPQLVQTRGPAPVPQTRQPSPTRPPAFIAPINNIPLIETNPERCPHDFAIMALNYCKSFAVFMASKYGSTVLYQATWAASQSCRFHSTRCDVKHPTVGNSFETEVFDFTGMCTGAKSALFEYNYRWVLAPNEVIVTSGNVVLPEGVSTKVMTMHNSAGAVIYASKFTLGYEEAAQGTWAVLHIEDTEGVTDLKIHIADAQLLSSCNRNPRTLAPPPLAAPTEADNTTAIIVGVVVGVGVLLLAVGGFVMWRRAHRPEGYGRATDADAMDRERLRTLEMDRRQPTTGVPVMGTPVTGLRPGTTVPVVDAPVALVAPMTEPLPPPGPAASYAPAADTAGKSV